MIDKQTKIENARWVEGDLGVHFVYTAGPAGEEFLRALQKGKILASTCDTCSTTYCPPRLFCEDCFHDVTDRHEVEGRGTIESLTRVEVGPGGAAIDPEWVAAIRLDGTDSTILHRLAGDGYEIGDRVEAVWAAKRTGTILDIAHFKPGAAAREPAKRPDGNGRKRAVARRRLPVTGA
jgi:hypothetical protein